MIDRFCYRFFAKMDDITEWIAQLFAPRCKCKGKKKK